MPLNPVLEGGRKFEVCLSSKKRRRSQSLADLIAAGTSTKRMRNIYHDSQGQELISDIVRDYRVRERAIIGHKVGFLRNERARNINDGNALRR